MNAARGRRVARALTLLLIASALAVHVASAHANVKTADPAPNTRFDPGAWPANITLTFTEPLDASFTEAHLLDEDQERVEAAPARFPGPFEMRLAVPAELPDGIYVYTWRALSTADGHVTAGAWVYIVGNASIPSDFDALLAAGQNSDDASGGGGAGETAARAVALAGAFLLIGSAVFALFVAPDVFLHNNAARDKAFAFARGGVWVGIAGAALAAIFYAARVAGADADTVTTWQALATTRVGWTWLVRIITFGLGAAALGLINLNVGAATARGAWGLALGAGVVNAAAAAAASHAAGGPLPLVGVAVDLVHYLAGAAWLGGLPLLAVLLASSHGRDGRVRAALTFSTLATWSVAAVVLTGVVLSFTHLETVANLWLTPWGRALLTKLLLVGALLGVGAFNKFVLVPRLEAQPERALAGLAKVVSWEAGLGVAVIVAVALLTALGPPGSSVEPPDRDVIMTLEDEGRYGTAFTLRLGPANPVEPGLHLYEVRAVTDAGVNVTRGNVTIQFTFLDEDIGTSKLALNVTDDEAHRGLGGNLALPGLWRVEVFLTGRPDALDERVAFDVVVAGRDGQS